MTYGWNTTAYQILNPGIAYWFHPSLPAVVGYTQWRKFLLVAGAPVCPADALGAAVATFEEFARQRGLRVCYVCAAERMRELCSPSPAHSIAAIGAQPIWDPRRWHSIIESNGSLRAQLHRARNKGVVVTPMAPELGHANAELAGVLDAWLGARHLPPLHFMVEPHTLDGIMSDRILLIARCAGRAVAFLLASPAPARDGYLIEQIARVPHAPNGTSELLIDTAMRQFAESGHSYATLGLVALAHAADAGIRKNPAWMRLMMMFARLHANRFYNFRGLENFRLKLAPHAWEIIYAISNESRFSAATLYAIGEAFANMSPWRALAIGAGRALRHELRTLRGKGVRLLNRTARDNA
jgi:phosphatidylglycerol lysyltransferase